MKQFTLLIVFAFLFSCKDAQKTSNFTKKEDAAIVTAHSYPGKKLMETNCYVCHSPSASHDNRIGPPMVAIKKHYLSIGTTKEEFTTSMQDWIKNPTKENAKMNGAVKRFGVMPKQDFPEETIKQIAEYMFDNDIEKPAWFEDHLNEKKGKGKAKGAGNGMKNKKRKHNQVDNLKDLSYSEKGLKYALSTKAVLGKNLMRKIQKEGTLAALKFCNIQAYPLTDSMSVVHNAAIKRVSDKPRNPKNFANNKENEYIRIFKNDAKLNKSSEPIVVENESNVSVYYPIITNGMCLQCHGNPKTDIKPDIFKEIRKKYPNDVAIGYSINQVRGIWNVTFDK